MVDIGNVVDFGNFPAAVVSSDFGNFPAAVGGDLGNFPAAVVDVTAARKRPVHLTFVSGSCASAAVAATAAVVSDSS